MVIAIWFMMVMAPFDAKTCGITRRNSEAASQGSAPPRVINRGCAE